MARTKRLFEARTLALGLAVLATGCGRDVCSAYREIYGTPSELGLLKSWVAATHADGKLAEEHSVASEAERSFSRLAGDYVVGIDDARVQAMLPGDALAWVNAGADGQVDAVFFGRDHYAGLLIQVPGQRVRLNPGYYKRVDDSAWYVCNPR